MGDIPPIAKNWLKHLGYGPKYNNYSRDIYNPFFNLDQVPKSAIIMNQMIHDKTPTENQLNEAVLELENNKLKARSQRQNARVHNQNVIVQGGGRTHYIITLYQ